MEKAAADWLTARIRAQQVNQSDFLPGIKKRAKRKGERGGSMISADETSGSNGGWGTFNSAREGLLIAR